LVLSAFVVPLFAANPGSAASYTIKVTSPATGAQVSSLGVQMVVQVGGGFILEDRKSTRLNSSHGSISYAVFCWKKKIVLGYGWAGEGVAERARGAGAGVIGCEGDPRLALEARMAGQQAIAPLAAAARSDVRVIV